jgi:Recombination endonuclease VII
VTNPDTITSEDSGSPVNTVKTCKKCGAVKQVYGGVLRCVPCHRKYKQTPKYKGYMQKYSLKYSRTTDLKKYYRKYHQTPEYKEYYRDRHFRLKYGLTTSGVESKIVEQGNACLCCKRPFDRPTPRNPMAPVVDHCHETGSTRGIICQTCNSALGRIRSKRHLHQLGRYLYGRDWQSTQENFL